MPSIVKKHKWLILACMRLTLFLKLKHSSDVLVENLITVLNSARSSIPYLILTIKHAVMPKFSHPFIHTRTREKNLQSDQCIFTDNKSRQRRIQTGAPSRDTCESLQLLPGYKMFEEVKVPSSWCSSAAVRLCNVHHPGRHSWQDSYGDIAS